MQRIKNGYVFYASIRGYTLWASAPQSRYHSVENVSNNFIMTKRWGKTQLSSSIRTTLLRRYSTNFGCWTEATVSHMLSICQTTHQRSPRSSVNIAMKMEWCSACTTWPFAIGYFHLILTWRANVAMKCKYWWEYDHLKLTWNIFHSVLRARRWQWFSTQQLHAFQFLFLNLQMTIDQRQSAQGSW